MDAKTNHFCWVGANTVEINIKLLLLQADLAESMLA